MGANTNTAEDIVVTDAAEFICSALSHASHTVSFILFPPLTLSPSLTHPSSSLPLCSHFLRVPHCLFHFVCIVESIDFSSGTLFRKIFHGIRNIFRKPLGNGTPSVI